MKKRYEMGVMDLYPISSNKTKMENNPFIQIEFADRVDPDRLYEAVKTALSEHPLFACTLKHDKGFYLETNDAEFNILNVDYKNRPLAFGDNTNGFLWQMCYNECSLTFEWCHSVSDGKGGFAFFASVLCHYFSVSKPVELALDLGLESFYDKSEKGIPQKKQGKGFAAKDLPYIKRSYVTDCHTLHVPMKEVLVAAKRSDASPAAVIPPLFSMALRKHIKQSAKNRNVRCNIVIDCRVPMKHKTMHNCILSKVITYDDRFDKKDFPLVSTIYRSLLDLAVQPENIVCEATNMVNTLRPLVNVKPRFLQKILAKIVAGILRHTDSNFTFTYLGKIDLPDEVMAGITDLNFRSWTDFGECNITAIDFKGTLILNISENYKDKEIIPDFIDICSSVGINFEKVDELVFEQANLRMASI